MAECICGGEVSCALMKWQLLFINRMKIIREIQETVGGFIVCYAATQYPSSKC